jgi:prepilin-type N-terminal cleavage/methylation domain-containing protein
LLRFIQLAMVLNNFTTRKGFALIELLVTAAIMLIIFGGIFVGFRFSLDLITQSRAKLSGLTLANERMEYIHSLSYDAVGTVSGIPNGAIAQTSTTTLNNIVFTETVLIQYVDDPADGTGAADSNGITTDYKLAKVTESWQYRGVTQEVFLVSNIIPRSIETNVGGGTLRVNVFDSKVQPLPGADVRLWNTTGTTSIDVTRTTDATGVALFGGAPANSDYQISVTAPGYSTDQTYMATTSLPNPTTQPVAVRAADISTMNFFIDSLSTFTITTLSGKTSSSTTYSFATLGQVASSSAVAANSNALVLTSSAGVYASSGMAYLTPIVPTTIAGWDVLTVSATTSINTSVLVSLYTGTSTYTIIPDSDLPGNSAGFAASTIILNTLSAITYPNLVVQARLATASSTLTPQLGGVQVSYVTTKTVIPNAALTIHGDKTIGTLLDTSLVYKFSSSTTTNGSGVRVLNSIEWDAYTVTPSGYDIAEACPANPVAVPAHSSTSLELVLVANTSDNLRVVVQQSSGGALAGATVSLARSGYSDTAATSACGQVFFSGLTSASDYTLTVSAPGYTTQNFTNVSVSGDVVQTVTF